MKASWRMLRIVVASLLVCCAAGCANYGAVSRFADETGGMTGVVKAEFTTLDTLCAQQALVVIVVNNLADDRALSQCDRYRRSQSRFAAVTVDVLDEYAAGLSALADDRTFDLTPDIKTVGTRVRTFKDAGGSVIVSDAEATAVTRIADLLVTVFATGKREEGVRWMLAAAPDLETLGLVLKSFFVGPAGTKSPYANFVDIVSGSTSSTQIALDNKATRAREPIRTAELARELKARQQLLDLRATRVPTRIAAAIDAWLAALAQFEAEGMKPDARELADRLKTLRDATRTAKAAAATP